MSDPDEPDARALHDAAHALRNAAQGLASLLEMPAFVEVVARRANAEQRIATYERVAEWLDARALDRVAKQ